MDQLEEQDSDTRSIEELFQAALSDPNEDVVWVAVSAIQGRTSFEALKMRRLDCTSENASSRAYAARELSTLELPEELLHDALAHPEDDAIWETVSEHVRQQTQAVFERAKTLCASQSARERLVGAGILGQMGYPDETIREGSITLLLDMLEHEQDPNVLNSIAVALGHRKDPRAIAPLIRLKNHPHEDVRFGVVYGLLGHEDERAIATLRELSTDEASEVRDWATFGLGSMIETDTPEIREALLARLTDEDTDTRGEAMVGLAKRHDERVIEPLIAQIQQDFFGTWLAEAAEELADPRLYAALVHARDHWTGEKNWQYKDLEEAIEKCRPASDA